MSEEILKQLAGIAQQNSKSIEMLSKQMHTKTPASAGTFTELHGDGSILGSEPIERDVITAMITPMGLGTMLPKIPTVFAVPRFASLTGITDTHGSVAAEPCDDNPQAFWCAIASIASRWICCFAVQFPRAALRFLCS